MNLYQSGTPRNDIWQPAENSLCTHRLVSLHASYETTVLKWIDDIRYAADFDTYVKRNPGTVQSAHRVDIRRRTLQARLNDTRDFNSVDVARSGINSEGSYPRHIMLDSGAFTAWQKGHTIDVDDASNYYERFFEASEGLFDSVIAVNLDVIPGERGRDPTPEEIKEAVAQSDVNLEILKRRFGDVILPVFHQGESEDRLEEVISQARYICLSPRNDVAETHRVTWSRDTHAAVAERVKTHGLATTGNNMIKTVSWTSGDSAAFILHGGMGMVDVYFEDGEIDGLEAHYKSFFAGLEHVNVDEEYDEHVLGHTNTYNYYANCTPGIKAKIRRTGEELGLPFPAIQWNHRVRNLMCMWSILQISKTRAPVVQSSLF